MSKKDWMGFAAFMTVVVLLFGFAWFLGTSHNNSVRREQQFAGACKVLNGEVHGDLCIKDDKVVLDRSEFDKEK